MTLGVMWISQPGVSFIAFLSVWPAGSLSPPKSDGVGFGTADSPFRTCPFTGDNEKAYQAALEILFPSLSL